MLAWALGECKSLEKYNIPKAKDGWPEPAECTKRNFLKLYTAPEVASAFEYFWNNGDGIQDRFTDYWRVLATKFAKNPNVIGYDIINEPFAANIYKDSSLLTDTKKFDREILFPFYERIGKEIRKVDTEHLIFFEPNQFPNVIPILGGIVNEVGFQTNPGGPEFKNRTVLDEHAYCCGLEIGVCDTGEPPINRLSACREFHSRKINTRKKDGNRLGVPLMVSEFGACSGSIACFEEIKNVGDACDEVTASWAYWMFKGFGDFTTISTSS